MSNQADVLVLIFVSYLDVPSTRNEVNHLVLSESQGLGGEIEIDAQIRQRMVQDLFERLIVVRFDGLDVLVVYIDSQNVLIEAACEVRIHKVLVADGLADDSPHEGEVVQMVDVDH